MLKQVFGTDQISFQDCGATLPAGSTCYDLTPVSVRTPTSLRRQTRTRIHASSLGSTSATRPQKELSTVERLASVPPLSLRPVE